MYRVDGEDSLFSTGYYDYLGGGLLLIEWSENIETLLPADAWRLTLTYGEQEGERIITLENEAGNYSVSTARVKPRRSLSARRVGSWRRALRMRGSPIARCCCR